MRIVQDTRSDEVLRIEHLLYRFNCAVWINTSRPFDLSKKLKAQLFQ